MKLDWIRSNRGMMRSVMPAVAMMGLLSVPGPAMADDDGQPGPVRYDGHAIVEATTTSWDQVAQMEEWGVVPLDCHIHVGTGQFVVPPAVLELMTKADIPYNIMIDDVQPLLDAERERLEGGIAEGGWFADYKDSDAINAYMDTLVALEPGIVTKFVVGQTLQNRPIYGYRITGPGSDKPAVLFNGGQHAREWVSPMVNVYIADQLIRNYDTDPTIQELVDDVEFIIIPVFNVDGYIYSWDQDRFWRKNRRNNGGGDFGVDLNRNWGVDWNGGQSNSNDPGSDVYVGTSAFSEPETQVMSAFITANPQIVAHIDFHSFSQVILRTWGYTNALPPDIDQINELGFAMSDAIFDTHGFNYPHGGGGDLLYLASGIFPDWAYGERGILSWTVELRPSSQAGGGFELPPAQILPTGEENFQAILVLATWAQASPAINFDFPSGRPDVLVPDTTTIVAVDVESVFGAVVTPGSETVYTRTDGGAFTPSAMSPIGGGVYEAMLPAVPCGETLEYYFEVSTDGGETFTSPDDAPATVFSADSLDVEVIAELDFEVDPAWLVSGNATDGQWDLGVPAGGGDRSDPAVDFDGSGACYLTDNVDGNSDVDGGVTILTTSTFDLTGGADISWAYWLNDVDNPMGPEDYFIVELATDLNGTNWQQISDYSAAGVWRTDSVNVSEADATSTVRLRFSVADNSPGSVIEAGVDAMVVSSSGCDDTGDPCLADVVGDDDEVDIQDLLALLSAWGTSDPIFDIAPDGGDGTVDIQDLLTMLSSWGPCP